MMGYVAGYPIHDVRVVVYDVKPSSSRKLVSAAEACLTLCPAKPTS
ncbi:MAG: hypothetical protein ACLRW2_06705 [Parasutterella excrementihominis]